jgi:3-mercaptopyruvate sulfurtransferase SseA
MLKLVRGDVDVRALEGGIQGWQERGYPLEGSEPDAQLKVA